MSDRSRRLTSITFSLSLAVCGIARANDQPASTPTNDNIAEIPIAQGDNIAPASTEPSPAPGSTVLACEFADRLSLSQIRWPSVVEQDRARYAFTEFARVHAVCWLTRLVAPAQRPFPPPWLDPPTTPLQLNRDRVRWVPPGVDSSPDYSRPKARDYRRRFTAAISDEGRDLMCARWSTATHHLQFIAAQELIRLAVEPVRPGPRGSLTAEQVTACTRHFLESLLPDAAQLLNYCDLQSEPADYGYCITVRCRDPQAWSDQWAPGTSLHRFWFLYLVVHTDGVSFVLDVKPMLSANVRGPRGEPLQRWFTPPRVPVDWPHPTTAPALGPDEVQAKLRLLEELARQRREQRDRQ